MRIIFLAVLFSTHVVVSQIDPTLELPATSIDSTEVRPSFPGGMMGFYQYIAANLRFPEDEKVNRMLASFVVETDGSLTDIQVGPRKFVKTCAEIRRVIAACPKWNPGIVSSKPVRVQYSLPITVNSELPEGELQSKSSLRRRLHNNTD